MSAFQAGPRPGVVAPLAAITDVLRISVAAVASAIGPVLATSLGFAVAALVDLSLGRDPFRFVLTTVFTATFLSLLVAGYFSTLAFGVLFVAGLACLVAVPRTGGLPDEGTRHRGMSVGAAVLLFGTAAMAHPQFVVVGAAVVGGSVVALAPSVQRDRHEGISVFATSAVVTGTAFVAGATAGLGAVAAIGPEARAHVDTSRDAILRRLGLSSLTSESYREVLRRFFPWFRVLTVGGLAALPLFVRANAAPPESPEALDRRRLFWGAMAGWGAVTVVAVVALIAGARSPGQRLAAFCLPLPILAAVGLRRLSGRLQAEGKTRAAAVVLAVGVLWVAVAFLGWGKLQPLVSGDSAAQFQTAGRALAAQPSGTPIILVVHDFMGDPGIRTTRYTNYLRAAVPPARMTDVHLFWGTPRDFVARRPTLIGQFEHDRLASAYWNHVRRTLDRRPLAVAFQGLDPRGHAQAIGLGGRDLGHGVAVLPGFSGAQPVRGLRAEWTEVGAGRISPWLPVWLSPVVLVLLALVGWPWVVSFLPRIDRMNAVALTPAFGLATLGLASWSVDAMGLRLLEGGGLVAAALLVIVGWTNWIWTRRSIRRSAQGPPT
ncbi:MAG: hypothetical protein M3N24_04750 [Actinomycetota bacterium]|nr:hypothetical protein [Actinomycetota bacterium]